VAAALTTQWPLLHQQHDEHHHQHHHHHQLLLALLLLLLASLGIAAKMKGGGNTLMRPRSKLPIVYIIVAFETEQ